MDLSLSGALVELDGNAQVGHQTTLVLSNAPLVLELDVRVVRNTSPTKAFPSKPSWLVAVTFLQVSDAARQVLVRSLARAAAHH